MLDVCRRDLLRGIASVAAAAVPVTTNAAQSEQDAVIGTVKIADKMYDFGEFHFDESWGGPTTEKAVVIMEGRIQVRQLACYSNVWPWYASARHIKSNAGGWSSIPDDRRTGLVEVGPKKWVRVPVLGRVLREGRA
jgi:hypothetical protein